MSIVNVIPTRGTRSQIGGMILDVTVREQHKFKNNITSYPVEDGSPVTDNIIEQVQPFIIEGIISNAVINPQNISVVEQAKIKAKNHSGRDSLWFTRLLEIGGFDLHKNFKANPVRIKQPSPVNIYTGLKTYVNMYLETLTVNRTKQTAGGLFFTASFLPLKKVSNNFTKISVVADIKGAQNMKAKIQNTAPTGPAVTTNTATDPTKSAMHSLLKKLSAKFGG